MSRRFALAVAAVVAAAACSTDGTGPDVVPVATVTVSPSDGSLVIGESRELSATTRAGDGTVLTGRALTWSSTNESVAEVSAAGVVTARAAGTARIRATSEQKVGEAEVVVSSPAVASVDLSHTTAAMEEGELLELTATPRDAQGNAIAGLGMQWNSSVPEVASVDALGRVTALRPGSTSISVQVHGKEAAVDVSVATDYGYDLLYSTGTSVGNSELYRLQIGSEGAAPARVFPAGSWASQAVPSPDGTHLAFVCPAPSGAAAICVSDLDGTDRTLVAAAAGATMAHPTWSPDGSRIAYVRTEPDGGTGGNSSRIWVVNADGTGEANLTAGMEGDQIMPAWSPALSGGAERIAFASGAGTNIHIRTVAPDGTDVREVTSGSDLVDTAPAWSPDGETIAFQRISATIASDIWLVDADGGNERPLGMALAGSQHSPAWSPDGRLVAFVSTHETYGSGTLRHQIYTRWADGSKLARRTFDDLDKLRPSWLPNR